MIKQQQEIDYKKASICRNPFIVQKCLKIIFTLAFTVKACPEARELRAYRVEVMASRGSHPPCGSRSPVNSCRSNRPVTAAQSRPPTRPRSFISSTSSAGRSCASPPHACHLRCRRIFPWSSRVSNRLKYQGLGRRIDVSMSLCIQNECRDRGVTPKAVEDSRHDRSGDGLYLDRHRQAR